MPDRKVDLLAREVDVVHRRGHAQIDLGMGLGEPAEPMDAAIWRQNPVTC